MGRYIDAQSKLFSVFASAAWLIKNIKTYPSDFSPTDKAEEFIRVHIIASSEPLNMNSLSGILLIEIYTAFGKGPTRANEIADILDDFLKSITIENWLQLTTSTLMPKGQDRENSLLTRSDYTIPFNLYGVTT
jgi:hypothetical protein